MSSTDRGRKRSLEVTGGPAQAAARSMLRAMGWTTDDLKLPQAGVAASWNAVTPCNMHVVEIDAESNRLHVELPDDEIASRLAAVEHPPPRYPTGVLAKYARLVGSAATGARVGA